MLPVYNLESLFWQKGKGMTFAAHISVLMIYFLSFFGSNQGADEIMLIKLSLTVDGKDALLRRKRTAKGYIYRLNLEGLRTAVGTSVVIALGLCRTLDAEYLVAWTFASDWLG